MAERAKKVLIITYYWPPSAGSGVQRWLKFVKYLPDFGWQPFVFTPENPSFSIMDESLQKDVPSDAEILRFPIWEPYEAFGKISRILGGKKSLQATELIAGKSDGLFQRFSTWVRGNFFIPDPRKFWVKPSVRFLNDFLRDNDIKVIITTGPPHSIHLIGLGLKEKNPSLKWFADFRDPWSEWGLLDSLKVGPVARKAHRKLESKVLSKADHIITITPFYQKRFESLSNRKVTLLTNGFDESDFTSVVRMRSDKFVIRHVGIINEKCNPRPFMLCLKQLMNANPDFAKDIRLEFIGEVNPGFRNFTEANATLNSVSSFVGNIPHKKLLETYGSSSLLLIILTGYRDAEGYLPGKLFEYLATGIPIVGTGPENGDAARVLNDSGAGTIVNENKSEAIKALLLDHYVRWKSDVSRNATDASIQKFSRKAITKQLSDLLSQEIP